MKLVLVMAAAMLSACSAHLDIGSSCEEDVHFCNRLNKNCGSVSGLDLCGQTRTVQCGSCEAPQECGAHGRANVCGFVDVTWKSGVFMDNVADVDGFAQWRGRPVEVVSFFDDDIYDWGGLKWTPTLRKITDGQGRMLSFAQPLRPTSEGSLRECAEQPENYRDHFIDSAHSVQECVLLNNWAKAYIRLGWQDNESCPWCPQDASEDEDWVKCFRIASDAFRSVSKSFKIVWNMNRRISGDVSRLWPGDEYVDVVGVDFYDTVPGITNQAQWDQDYASVQGQGPRGLGAWIEFAKNHGKKLAVPEWGISSADPNGGGDNSFFIENMYNFFRTNTDQLEYEAVYNKDLPNYKLYPITADANPNAADRYRLLWSGQ